MRSGLSLLVALLPLAACTYSIDGGDAPRRTDPAQPSVGGVGGTPSEQQAPQAPSAAKRAFVTSTTFHGDLASELASPLKGAAAADALCQAAADAAMLGGEYQAYIEDTVEHANTRIEGTGPWVTTTGQRVFNNRANLTTKPLTPLNLDENGATVSGYAWTGIGDRPAPGDTYAAQAYCSDWSGYGSATVGNVGATDQKWRVGGIYARHSCHEGAHLYCFEK